MGALKERLKKTWFGKIYWRLGKFYKKIRKKMYKFATLRIYYPSVYKKYSKLPIDEKKIVFIEIRLPELTNSFKLIFDELVANYDFDIHPHFLRNTFVTNKEYMRRCHDMVKDIATSKYVFMAEASNVVSSFDLRKETSIIQTWHGCGAFKKFGFSTADLIFGDTRDEMLKYPFNKNYKYVTVSSPEVVWAYEEAMNLKDQKGVIVPTGISRTDIFYDETFIEQAKEKLKIVMPSSKEKKVLLYAPTFRGRVAKASTPNMFSVELFAKEFLDEYVILIKHHPLVRNPAQIPEKYCEFARDMTDEMTIEELLCVSDICISDYSSLVFEYSLFEKPMIFFSYDLSEYFDWRGFYYDYFQLAPGPVFTTNMEMIDYIRHIDERFDKKRVIDFRNKFMCSCDGNATKRILEMALGDDLDKNRRDKALEGEFHMVPHVRETYTEREEKLSKLRAVVSEARSAYVKYSSVSVVKRKVLLLYKDSLAQSLKKLREELKNYPDVKLSEINYKKVSTDSAVKEIASSEYVVLSGICEIINAIDIKKETTVIQLWQESFPFKKFGNNSKEVIGGLNKDYTSIIPVHGHYDIVPVASKEHQTVYAKSFGISEESCKVIGSCSSDILFDEKFRHRALEKLKYYVQDEGIDMEGRKIICYLPQVRHTKTRPNQAVFMNPMLLNEYLSKDYIIIYNYKIIKDEKLRIEKYFKPFLSDMTDKMTVQEMMAAADIMIGDYREEMFDFAALEKPILIYAPDYQTYLNNADTNFKYQEMFPNNIYTDTKDIIEQLLDINNYDYSDIKKFKEKYLTMNDGHAVKRLAEIIGK